MFFHFIPQATGPVFGRKEYTHVSKNTHTAGPKSFAEIREDLKNKDLNQEPSTMTQVFECRRERTKGNVYGQVRSDSVTVVDYTIIVVQTCLITLMNYCKGSCILKRIIYARKKLKLAHRKERYKAEIEAMSKDINDQQDNLVENVQLQKDYLLKLLWSF
ncbi:hypothetical protein Tco_0352382 [Tanacetum coccineum]